MPRLVLALGGAGFVVFDEGHRLEGRVLPSITSVSWWMVRPMRWSVTRFFGG